jgi:hypothetical protein
MFTPIELAMSSSEARVAATLGTIYTLGIHGRRTAKSVYGIPT